LIETALFDLDGTLIDSIELIRRSYEHTLRVHYDRELTREDWLSGLGRPLRWQFAHYTQDEREIDAMIATYRAYNRDHHDAMVTAFPGTVDAVRSLKEQGLALAIVTSKLNSLARRGLEIAGFQGVFDVIVGADDVREHKPDPAPVAAALALLGRPARTAVMVGDSPHDLASGRAAGAFTAAVAWGPFERGELERAEPDHWLEDAEQIARLALS
jgi:pyrophosphatase PpaX